MKRLVVTADDFGAAREVNEAIEIAHTRGILTATSLMVAAPAAAEAVCLPARTRPFGEVRMAVGTGGYKSTGFTMVQPISGCGEIAVSADWTKGGNAFRRR